MIILKSDGRDAVLLGLELRRRWLGPPVQSGPVDTQEVIWIPNLIFEVVGASPLILVLCIDALFLRTKQQIAGCEREFASVVEIEDLCLVMLQRSGEIFLR